MLVNVTNILYFAAQVTDFRQRIYLLPVFLKTENLL